MASIDVSDTSLLWRHSALYRAAFYQSREAVFIWSVDKETSYLCDPLRSSYYMALRFKSIYDAHN